MADARLQWRQVAAPDLTGASNILANASTSFNGGFDRLQQQLEAGRLRKQESASNALIPQLAGVRTEGEVNSFLQNMNIDPKNMSPELREAILGLRGEAMDYDTQRLTDDGTRAATANTRNNTRIASNIDGRQGTLFDRQITREDQLAALAPDVVRMREQAYNGDTDRRIAWRDGIASIESDGSGGYSAVGANNPTLGRALGRYQIMEANLPEWSKAALGREVTAEEFLKSSEIQDAIFDHRFGSYVEKYGEEGAAQAWFGGEGGVGKTNRTDVHGRLNIGEYGNTFVNSLADIIPENSLIDLSTLLNIADGNYTAFNKGEENRDANRSRDYNFGQQVVGDQRTEQQRLAEEAGAQIALDAARSGNDVGEVTRSIINNPNSSPAEVQAALSAANNFTPEAQFQPDFDPTGGSSPDISAIDATIQQYTSINDAAVGANTTARVNRRAASLGDDPAQALLESIPNISATKGEVLSTINEVIASVKREYGVDISPAEAGVLIEENTYEKGISGVVPFGKDWGGIYFDTNAAIEAGGNIFSEQGRREASELEFNAATSNAQLQGARAQLDEVNQRIALQESRGNTPDPELLKAQKDLIDGMLNFSQNNPTVNRRGTFSTNPAVNNSTQAPSAPQAPTLADTAAAQGTNPNSSGTDAQGRIDPLAVQDAFEFMNADPAVGEALGNPNLPIAERIRIMDSLVQKAQSDLFMPAAQRRELVKQLELIKSNFTSR